MSKDEYNSTASLTSPPNSCRIQPLLSLLGHCISTSHTVFTFPLTFLFVCLFRLFFDKCNRFPDCLQEIKVFQLALLPGGDRNPSSLETVHPSYMVTHTSRHVTSLHFTSLHFTLHVHVTSLNLVAPQDSIPQLIMCLNLVYVIYVDHSSSLVTW